MAAKLGQLLSIKAEYGGDAARRKLELLGDLERTRLARPRDVFRLHDALLFLRAYPDDTEILALTERMLDGFSLRRDLRRHRAALAGSGIAGTEVRFCFFAPTARWLAWRWGDRLKIDWKEFDGADRLDTLLPLLVHHSETPGIDQLVLSTREWIRRLKGPAETDAAFLVRRFGALRVEALPRETLYESLDVPMILTPAEDTPSRTRARLGTARVFEQSRPLRKDRPNLAREARRSPRSVREATRSEAREIVDLARGMMVTMNRDLDAFAHASEQDVRLVDCGRGMLFAFLGCLPHRRLLLEALYGYVVFQNGIPIGYGTVASLFRSSEVAFNVTEAFRGGEASHVFARLLSCVRALFGSDTFCLDPYQLGEDNDEALASGAFWFYQKLGFESREASVRRLVLDEIRRRRTNPSHRSSRAVLRKLATAPVFFQTGRLRADVLGALGTGNVGLRVTEFLADRFGWDRERGAAWCSREAARLLSVRDVRALSSGERLAWDRFAPVVCILPDVERWSAAERRDLAAVILAKGGRRESDFVARFDAHPKLRSALVQLATER